LIDSTERLDLLSEGRVVEVGGREAVVAARRGTDARPLLALREVDDRDSAEALRGADITVARGALGALGEGEYLPADLVGLEVGCGDQAVGRVREVLFLPSVEALEVVRPGRGTLLVPLVRDAVRAIDLDRGRIDVDLGFLEPGQSGGSEDG
jgi:16S rRNA processing protein RimM